RVRLATPMDVQQVLRALEQGNEQKAREHGRAVPGPAGEMLVAAMDHLDEKKEYIEEVMYERMLATKPRLEALLPFIALTATAAPLLGLLGTVTGMISTFSLISLFGTGDPRTLSSGISEALVTTKWGLLIAIPAVLIYAFLNRKAKGLLASMEQTAVSFINGLPERRESAVA
ncbi:MAG TPA: MotA/TolQ/ExbB proton channel family protein, partial [Verrucomicrobiota bacterium]|nr:MotA/TolQ/ExbB proton channel family protein [Verrucomicrobiota bacterium]